MLETEPFETRLYDKTSKTITVNTEGGTHIAWMGLDWSADYKFFQMDEVVIGSQRHLPEVEGATASLADLSITSTSSNSDRQMRVKITYNPREAQVAVDRPHYAYLMIAFDEPNTGMVRIEITGFVRGICNECFTRVGEALKYVAKDSDGDGVGDFELYLCDSEAIPPSEHTEDPLPDGTDPSVPYNLGMIKLSESDEFFFYPSGDDVLIISGGDATTEPTIPPFSIPIPGGGPGTAIPLESVEVEMFEGKQVPCELDQDKGIDCSGTELSVFGGSIPVLPMRITTGPLDAGNEECPNFGHWQGSGSFNGSGPIKLIATTEIGSNTLVNPFKINGALIVAVIELTPVQ